MLKTKEMYCPKCGSPKVTWPRWVDQQTDYIKDGWIKTTCIDEYCDYVSMTITPKLNFEDNKGQ